MKRISSPNKRADYFKRHFSTFIPHLTLKKIINLLINEIEMQLSIASPKSFPPYIKVEPTPLCHLRCPGCLQKDYDFKKSLLKLNNGIMYLSLENLKTIINPIRNTLIGVSLSHYGEPMLNPHLSSLIEYLHNNNIAVSFRSENLKTIINPIRNTLIGVSLSHYGEPMLNPHLSSLIEYLHNNNIAVSFPTNLSIK